ncbi:MAG: replication-associated recombination protein A [Candidatus Auribacterota bacterium]|nr:replication-associated recombination protein A [Candidatus Auribacterota bacterium]
MELFDTESKNRLDKARPLADRLRPGTLEEIVGQGHVIAKGKLLWRAIKSDSFTSIILFGPPGCGKTALGIVIANTTKRSFHCLNAVTANVKDIRKIVSEAKNRLSDEGKKTVLFIDEIHRFNKAQQDALLPDVERGVISVVGATVMNPFFSVIPPLLSRSLIFELKKLEKEEIKKVIRKALEDKERGFGKMKVEIEPGDIEFISQVSGGDARKALNALEMAVLTTEPKNGAVNITREIIEDSVQKKQVVYDSTGDGHYDTASAFIKSMRGCDPDASVYWLAKMLYAGEDPMFITRRMVICASEDVGNADPMALVVAQAAADAVNFVGMPEAKIILSQAAVYIAAAPKSNASYKAISAAWADIEKGEVMEVPMHIKDSSYKSSKKIGRGVDYKYPHDFPGNYVKQGYLPKDKRYYHPSDNGEEKQIAERLKNWRRESKD